MQIHAYTYTRLRMNSPFTEIVCTNIEEQMDVNYMGLNLKFIPILLIKQNPTRGSFNLFILTCRMSTSPINHSRTIFQLHVSNCVILTAMLPHTLKTYRSGLCIKTIRTIPLLKLPMTPFIFLAPTAK
jgi:hypothetical protein